MYLKNTFLIVFALLLVQCKSTGSGQQTNNFEEAIPVILLLSENISPADLESVKSMQIESMKRISRTQNQWMLKVMGGQERALELINSLKADKRVIKSSLKDENEKTDQIQNTKSGKTHPI